MGCVPQQQRHKGARWIRDAPCTQFAVALISPAAVMRHSRSLLLVTLAAVTSHAICAACAFGRCGKSLFSIVLIPVAPMTKHPLTVALVPLAAVKKHTPSFMLVPLAAVTKHAPSFVLVPLAAVMKHAPSVVLVSLAAVTKHMPSVVLVPLVAVTKHAHTVVLVPLAAVTKHAPYVVPSKPMLNNSNLL